MLPPLGRTVTYGGEDVSHSTCPRNVLRGMSFIPSERFVFGDLSVLDNLRLGAMHESSGEVRDTRRNRVHKMFRCSASGRPSGPAPCPAASSACSASGWR